MSYIIKCDHGGRYLSKWPIREKGPWWSVNRLRAYRFETRAGALRAKSKLANHSKYGYLFEKSLHIIYIPNDTYTNEIASNTTYQYK